jgi:tRNA-specific 2-thiouridylase
LHLNIERDRSIWVIIIIKDNLMKRVVVGLSGGVDSSVAAYLLKKEGFDVQALFMKNWEDQQGVLTSNCTWEDDLMFARMAAQKLDIPLHFVDFSREYRQKVVEYLFSEYKAGRTPNPDILCNREIKFDLFLREAENLGADYIATGHYCRKQSTTINGLTIHSLLAGIDTNKDQSYFLCQLNQKQLSKSLFPLGNLHKSQVREMAADLGLATATRKDSQGICFVGKVDLPEFLQQKLKPLKGKIIRIPADHFKTYRDQENYSYELCHPPVFSEMKGEQVGEHNGAHNFTIGQRKGLNVGGTREPLYVLGTDIQNNTVYVGEGKNHPGLYRRGLILNPGSIHWIREDMKMLPGQSRDLDIRIRYRQPLQKGKLTVDKDRVYILFDQPQRGISPGQFAAWYSNDELLGSGVISQ